MPRYKCIVEYDGTGFAGWQRQKDMPSIQQSVEEAIESFSGEAITVHASGRTDAGVHAKGQVISFDIKKTFPEYKVMMGINYHLRPAKIAILNAETVGQCFHARFSAKKRYYSYRIINRTAPPTLERNRAWFVPVRLNTSKMTEAASFLIGRHDFTSFRDSQCQSLSPVKTVDDIYIECKESNITDIYVSAKSFLHHMVRNIAGTLKFIGQGKWPPEYVVDILKACDRSKAGPTAPPYGLYFLRTDY